MKPFDHIASLGAFFSGASLTASLGFEAFDRWNPVIAFVAGILGIILTLATFVYVAYGIAIRRRVLASDTITNADAD